MAFNPRPQPAEVMTQGQKLIMEAHRKVDQENIPLKSLPAFTKEVTEKIGYYIEIWKLGCKESDVIADVFNTNNIKHVLSLIVNAGHSVVYLQRLTDNKVIWNKR